MLLGLTGGIAIYKSANLLRRLVKDEGADVTVVMTDSAQQFMTPLIFETFSDKPVLTGMWSGGKVTTRHIDLATESELILVSPATANIVAKTAHGIADDLLSTIILAAGNKTVFALAMNVNMYENPITQANIAKLSELGYGFIEPEAGELACNTVGKGRLADETDIIRYIDQRLNGEHRLQGKKVIVTAGPTREYIDPVRYLSNRSSGKMGIALAEAAVKEGGEVRLICGPSGEKTSPGVQRTDVETAGEMQQALEANAQDADFLFMAAAVEDLAPAGVSASKIKKSEFPASLPIRLNPDLVSEFRRKHPDTVIVGFSVELEEGKRRSLEKLKSKGLDFIAWNDPSRSGAGFAGDTNEIILFSSTGGEWHFPLASKREIAEKIIRQVTGNRK